MLFRSTWPAVAVLLLSLASLPPSTADAHGVMREPESRAVGAPLEDYQYCYGTPDCECGNFEAPGEIVAVYEAGQVIHVSIDITKAHVLSPIFRFQLCPPGEQSPECFVAGEFAQVDFEPFEGTHEYDIQLPPGLACDPCVLRWKWDYGFLSCADVRIQPTKVGVGTESSWAVLKTLFR